MKKSLLHCWWECKLMQPLWSTSWRFLKKLGIKLQYDPGILLPQGKYSGENHNSKRHMYLNFIAALFTIARTWNQPGCPSTDEWIRKFWYI